MSLSSVKALVFDVFGTVITHRVSLPRAIGAFAGKDDEGEVLARSYTLPY
jgi:hypothetical protein